MVTAERIDQARLRLAPFFGKAKRRPYDGTQTVLADHCLDIDAILEPGRPTRVILTYDTGPHASGWWRNSDYDRCWHVSVSHPRIDRPVFRTVGAFDPLDSGEPPHPLHGRTLPGYDLDAPADAEVRAWARVAFPEHYRWCWVEPPASALDPYRMPGVAHVRLFLNRDDEPILPEGEVYTLKPWEDGTSPEKVFR